MCTIILVPVLLTLLPLAGLGNPKDSTVEIRLELLQETNGKAIRNLALDIVVINHTDHDVYIPGLGGGLDRSLSLCREVGGVFVWDSLVDYREEFAPPLFTEKTNDITSLFGLRTDLYFRPESSDPILFAYCRKKHRSYEEWVKDGKGPLFLKAHQRRDPIHIIGLNHVLKEDINVFRIRFEPRKVASRFRPRKIMGYARVDQAKLLTNTLYYRRLHFRHFCWTSSSRQIFRTMPGPS